MIALLNILLKVDSESYKEAKKRLHEKLRYTQMEKSSNRNFDLLFKVSTLGYHPDHKTSSYKGPNILLLDKLCPNFLEDTTLAKWYTELSPSDKVIVDLHLKRNQESKKIILENFSKIIYDSGLESEVLRAFSLGQQAQPKA